MNAPRMNRNRKQPEDMKNYTPKPIDLSRVTVSEELNELREAIAENVHEIWAYNRQKEGWVWGPERNDEKLEHPDMVPYDELPESEKQYDREMAMQTIKMILELGYDLLKREDTPLYRELITRLREKPVAYKCPQCGTVYLQHFVYCSGCGKALK